MVVVVVVGGELRMAVGGWGVKVVARYENGHFFHAKFVQAVKR